MKWIVHSGVAGIGNTQNQQLVVKVDRTHLLILAAVVKVTGKTKNICSGSQLLRFFFFFQAEDGIRDKLVTGVQTCALPIYALGSWTLTPVCSSRETFAPVCSPRETFGPSTRTMGLGRTSCPPSAKAVYAAATSSGVASVVPSASDGKGCGLGSPKRSASAATRVRPVLVAASTVTTLSECTRPVRSVTSRIEKPPP